MTPSFIGRMAWMLPGVRPIISRASSPTATIWLSSLTRPRPTGSRDDDALALDVDEDVGRAEVDADLHEVVAVRPFREALDPGAEVEELALDVLIAPANVVRAVDGGRALGGQGGQDQRGAGAQVADLDLGAVRAARAR